MTLLDIICVCVLPYCRHVHTPATATDNLSILAKILFKAGTQLARFDVLKR
jgi:hypothetical protein